MIPYETLVVFVNPKGRRYVKRLTEGMDWQSNDGALLAVDVANSHYGAVLKTSGGMPVRIEEATLVDRLMGLKRQTQIIYPKDIAWICMKLGIGPGKIVAEAGCGSGGLTVAFSWYCGESGKVVSHDTREEFVKLARRNLEWAGLGGNVELHCRDISEGMAVENADAVFLDMREPWLCINQALAAVRPGGLLGFLLPTVNQVEQLLLALEKLPVAETEVCEILIRQWKILPDRLRPFDRMAAHTGFLIFCRQQDRCEEFESRIPKGTREIKQEAARQARES